MNPIPWRKKWMAVTCSHGQFIDNAIADMAIKFQSDYKPDVTMHLGDWNDQTAFMRSAMANTNSTEAAEPIDQDLAAGAAFVERLRPQYLFQGNHDHRPYRLLRHPNAIVRLAAQTVVDEMQRFAVSIGAELVPYAGTHVAASWRIIGDTAFGHGYAHGARACEQHVFLTGHSTVFGHTHRMETQSAKTFGNKAGHTIGLIADIRKLSYAHTNISTAGWSNGWAYGEYGDGWCNVEVYRCKTETSKIPMIA